MNNVEFDEEAEGIQLSLKVESVHTHVRSRYFHVDESDMCVCVCVLALIRTAAGRKCISSQRCVDSFVQWGEAQSKFRYAFEMNVRALSSSSLALTHDE